MPTPSSNRSLMPLLSSSSTPHQNRSPRQAIPLSPPPPPLPPVPYRSRLPVRPPLKPPKGQGLVRCSKRSQLILANHLRSLAIRRPPREPGKASTECTRKCPFRYLI